MLEWKVRLHFDSIAKIISPLSISTTILQGGNERIIKNESMWWEGGRRGRNAGIFKML